MTLPVNIDSTYADDGGDASVALHQQHHDEIHAAVNNQGMTLISTQTASGIVSTFDFTSIPAIYRHLKVIYNLRASPTSAFDHRKVYVRINGDSGNNYQSMLTRANGTTVSVVSEVTSPVLLVGHVPTEFGTTAGLQGAGEFTILNYATTGKYRHALTQCVSAITEDTAAAYYNESGSGIWRNSAAVISSLTILPATGGWSSGSVCSLYGIK